MTPILCTLPALQSHVGDALDRDAVADGMTGSADVLEGQARRQGSNLATSLAVKYIAENQPPPTARGYHQMRRYVRQNLRRLKREQDAAPNDPTKCKFVFLILILEAILSWIVQSVCEKVWENYTNNPQATAVFAGMAQAPDVLALCGVALDWKPEDEPEDSGE